MKLTYKQLRSLESAAKEVSNKKQFACCAITKREGWDLRYQFAALFKPDEGGFVWYGETEIEENQIARSLAVLLFAEMGKRGDL